MNSLTRARTRGTAASAIIAIRWMLASMDVGQHGYGMLAIKPLAAKICGKIPSLAVSPEGKLISSYPQQTKRLKIRLTRRIGVLEFYQANPNCWPTKRKLTMLQTTPRSLNPLVSRSLQLLAPDAPFPHGVILASEILSVDGLPIGKTSTKPVQSVQTMAARGTCKVPTGRAKGLKASYLRVKAGGRSRSLASQILEASRTTEEFENCLPDRKLTSYTYARSAAKLSWGDVEIKGIKFDDRPEPTAPPKPKVRAKTWRMRRLKPDAKGKLKPFVETPEQVAARQAIAQQAFAGKRFTYDSTVAVERLSPEVLRAKAKKADGLLREPGGIQVSPMGYVGSGLYSLWRPGWKQLTQSTTRT